MDGLVVFANRLHQPVASNSAHFGVKLRLKTTNAFYEARRSEQVGEEFDLKIKLMVEKMFLTHVSGSDFHTSKKSQMSRLSSAPGRSCLFESTSTGFPCNRSFDMMDPNISFDLSSEPMSWESMT